MSRYCRMPLFRELKQLFRISLNPIFSVSCENNQTLDRGTVPAWNMIHFQIILDWTLIWQNQIEFLEREWDLSRNISLPPPCVYPPYFPVTGYWPATADGILPCDGICPITNPIFSRLRDRNWFRPSLYWKTKREYPGFIIRQDYCSCKGIRICYGEWHGKANVQWRTRNAATV